MATYIFSQPHAAPELITLAQAKQQLKLDAAFDIEDALIKEYIDAAISAAENYTNTSIYQAKFKVTSPNFENNYCFPNSPISSIETVKYLGEDNVEQSLDVSKYELRPKDKYVSKIFYEEFKDLPKVYSRSNAVSITVIAGYTSETLPKSLRQAIMLLIGTFYTNREDSVEALPKASTRLLGKYQFHY